MLLKNRTYNKSKISKSSQTIENRAVAIMI